MATSNVGQGGVQVIPGSTQTTYPQWFGFYYAIVSSNADPLNLARVQCRVPQVLGTEISAWAWSLLTEADMTLAGQASTTAAATGTGTGTTSGSGTGATTGSTSGSGTATAGTSTASQTATGAAAGTGTTITITPPAVGSVVLITFLGGDLSNPAYLLLYNSTVAGTATSNTTSGTTSNANSASTTSTTGGQPSVTTSTLSNALAGTAFSQTVGASGGYPPYTFSVSSGSLPSGTSIGSTTGVISGTPTTPGTASFTVQATDTVGNVCTKALTIKTLKSMSIANTPLATGTVGTPYTTTLTATGGTGTGYTWSICGGAWHPWASLAPSTGVLSGTPTIVATMTFTVKVTDSAGNWATQVFSLTTHT